MTIHPFLTVRQAATELGVSRQTIYNLCNDGTLPHGRIPGGSNIRIRRQDFDTLVERMFTPVVTTEFPPVIATPTPPAPKLQKTVGADGKLDPVALARAVAQRQAANGRSPVRGLRH